MRNLLFWILFPFLIPQALYVRQTAPRFAPAEGPNRGSTGNGKPVRLLAIGDSIIAGVGASILEKALVGQTARALSNEGSLQVDWLALGESGHNSTDLLNITLPKLPEEPFDYVIVSVGVNDNTGLTLLRNWRRNMTQIVEQLHTHSPDAVIAIAGMPPMHGFPLLPQPLRAAFGMRARLMDEETTALLGNYQFAVHVPLDFDPDPDKFSADGYHPSEESYVEFGLHMAEALLAN